MLNAISVFFRWLLLPRSEPREPRYPAQRYARQRRLGFPFLQFFPEIEREYRDSYYAVNIMRIRVAQAIGIAACFGFVAMDELIGMSLQPMGSVLVLLLVCVPALAAPIAATFADKTGQYHENFIFTGTLVMGLGMIVVVYLGRMANTWFPYEAMLLVTIHIYYVSGLHLRESMLCSWALWIAFAVVDIYGYGVRTPWFAYEIYYVLIANFIGMVGRYIFEYQDRLAFLMQRELRYLAQHDPLTGLYNRRAFQRNAEKIWSQAMREGKPVGLLLLDLDHFKKINDRYGHLLGDAVLLATAKALRTFARRPLDCAGRFGGDEYVAIWFDVEPEWFQNMLNGLHEKLSSTTLQHEKDTVKVHLSGGAVMTWPRPGLRLPDAMQVADANLYESKRNSGRITWTEMEREERPGETA